jgi:hypothetical protein
MFGEVANELLIGDGESFPRRMFGSIGLGTIDKGVCG